MNCFRRVLIFLPILLAFSLSSCVWVRKTQVKSAIDEAHQRLRSGDIQKALDTYRLAYEKYPKDSEILKSYVEAIESTKIQGDKACDAGDFIQAQMTYDLLLKNFPRFSDFADQLSFKEKFLAARLKQSRMLQRKKEAQLAANLKTNQTREAEKKAQLALRLKMSQIVQSEKEAQSFLESGDFQKGIDLYRRLIQQHPSDTAVGNRYTNLLESIKERADLDLKRKDFVLAGRTYRILLENYSSLGNLKQFLSYDAGLLDGGIKTCQKNLFEKGLKLYRSGDLSQAISIWENILAFDPENQEVKKAADMATLQSRNLGKIK